MISRGPFWVYSYLVHGSNRSFVSSDHPSVRRFEFDARRQSALEMTVIAHLIPSKPQQRTLFGINTIITVLHAWGGWGDSAQDVGGGESVDVTRRGTHYHTLLKGIFSVTEFIWDG